MSHTPSADRLPRVRTALALAGVAAFALSLTACNTVSGLGKDLQESSENTSEAVDKAIND